MKKHAEYDDLERPSELLIVRNKLLLLSHYHRFITLNSPNGNHHSR